MDLETGDVDALRATARRLAAEVEHLKEHCAYMAKIVAAERLHEVVPRTAAEVQAHRAVLRARIEHASDRGQQLAIARARDEAELAALATSEDSTVAVEKKKSSPPTKRKPAT